MGKLQDKVKKLVDGYADDSIEEMGEKAEVTLMLLIEQVTDFFIEHLPDENHIITLKQEDAHRLAEKINNGLTLFRAIKEKQKQKREQGQEGDPV